MSRASAEAKEIFWATLDIPSPQERGAYVEIACAGNVELRRRVVELLAAHDEPDPRFDEPGHVAKLSIGANSSTQVARPGTVIGPYQLVEQVGEGGMGIVYLAEQRKPVERRVALKIIKPGMNSRQVIARFEAERQALALMDHPNIAKVLDGGTTPSGLPYFVMELVQGVPITDFCDERRLILPERLKLFVRVCRAIQHAHQKGVLHRDIKPTNILVTEHDGRPLPKVIDFGVAKAMGAPLTEHTIYTASLQIIGTPLYMSPEQAEMHAQDVDTRSDVYSLGVLLYELLTGTVPFDKETLHVAGLDEMRRRIREDEPPRPSVRLSTLNSDAISTLSENRRLDWRRLRRSLQGELDWIVMKALEKERDRRYASANDLADDIERYLCDLPIVARPPTTLLRFRKLCRRHPFRMFSIVASLLLLSALATGTYWHNYRLGRLLAVSDRLQKEALAREKVLRQEYYATDFQSAVSFLAGGQAFEARRIVQRIQSSRDDSDHYGLEWSHLRKLASQPAPVRILRAHEGRILSADISSDHKLLASSDTAGTIKIWDVATGNEVKSLKHGDQEVTCVRFSPDGRTIATAGMDRAIRMWDVQSWTQSRKMKQHQRTVTCIAWSPDGKQLASSGRDHLVYIWNTTTRNVTTTLPAHSDVVRCLAWSPDGKRLATADVNRGVMVWDTANWSLQGSLPFRDRAGNPRGVLSITFSPDSQLLAYGGYDPSVRVAEVANLSEVASVDVGQCRSLNFLGDAILMAGHDRDASIVHFSKVHRQARVVRREIAAGSKVKAVIALGEQSQCVTPFEQEHSLAFWDLTMLLGYETTWLESNPLAAASKGEFLALTPYRRRNMPYLPDWLTIYRGTPLTYLTRLPYKRGHDCLPVFSPHGDLLAIPIPEEESTPKGECCVAIVDTATWQMTRRLKYPGPRTEQLVFSRDKTWLAAVGPGGMLGTWNTQDGSWREVLPPDGSSEQPSSSVLAFSPTEDLLAAARWNDKHITLWRPDRGIISQSIPGLTIQTAAFSPDGRMLATESDSVISLWDIVTGDLLGKITPNRAGYVEIKALAFSPEGTTLAGIATDSTLRLCDVESRRQLVSVPLPGYPRFLQFMTSGELVVGCSPNLLVRFDRSGKEISAR